jgi:hypothetical protein
MVAMFAAMIHGQRGGPSRHQHVDVLQPPLWRPSPDSRTVVRPPWCKGGDNGVTTPVERTKDVIAVFYLVLGSFV